MLRCLLVLFATATVLTGLGACSKHNDPAAQSPPAVSSNASYTLDGQTRPCQATYSAYTSGMYDILLVTLKPISQPSSGSEVLQLSLRKPTGQSGSVYAFIPAGSLVIYQVGVVQPLDFQHTSPLPVLSSAGLSGTFSGEVRMSTPGGSYAVVHTLQAGYFTNAQP